MSVSPKQRLHHTEIGYHYLREAYDAFKWAGAIHTAARIRACLKSAQGAVRHAERLERSGPGNRTIRVHRRKKYVGTPHLDHFRRTMEEAHR